MGKVGTPTGAYWKDSSPRDCFTSLPPQSHPLALTSGSAPWVGGGVGQWGWEKLRRPVFACVWKTKVGGRPDRATLRTGSQGAFIFSLQGPLTPALGSRTPSSRLCPFHLSTFLRNQVLGYPVPPQSLLSASRYSPPSHPHKSLKHLLNIRVPTVLGPPLSSCSSSRLES